METADRKLYSLNSAAHALDISRSTIYDMMKRGDLRYVLVGSDRRIPAEELDRIAAHGTAGHRVSEGDHSDKKR